MLRRRLAISTNDFSRSEALEVRILPASTSVAAGVLTVKNIAGPLTVETTAVANQIKVTDDSGVVLLNGVTTKVLIIGTNLSDSIQFIASAGGTQDFCGNVEVQTLNGDDVVDINGTIHGNLKLLTGLGVDTVTSTVGDVAVGGTLLMNDNVGANVFNMNGFNYTVGRGMTLSGVNMFVMGENNTLDVGESLAISTSSASSDPLVTVFGGTSTAICGSLKITGGLVGDVVVIDSQLSVGGSATFNMRSGDNTLVFTPTAGGTGIAGSFVYTGKTGIDVTVFSESSFIAGCTTINLGDGANTFVDSQTAQYGGNLSVIGGNGATTVVMTGTVSGGLKVGLGNGAGNTVVMSGAVGGGMTATFGNGDGNTFVMGGAISAGLAVTMGHGDGNVFIDSGTVGTKMTVRLGNGAAGVVVLAPPAPSVIDIDATFGSGDSTFTLGSDVSLTGKVTGKGGTYTFDPGTAVLLPALVLKNYP